MREGLLSRVGRDSIGGVKHDEGVARPGESLSVLRVSKAFDDSPRYVRIVILHLGDGHLPQSLPANHDANAKAVTSSGESAASRTQDCASEAMENSSTICSTKEVKIAHRCPISSNGYRIYAESLDGTMARSARVAGCVVTMLHCRGLSSLYATVQNQSCV